ncbi:ankyrin repeat-containing domain protein [Gorgonomyces haynaldii]|nr:ankyrin repeat-containing domain protein [Gorgonomyces haynaldii]
MHLTSLPNELLKKVTQGLQPWEYMRLHRSSRLLYSKRLPYNFEPPTEDLDSFLREAPLDAIENLVITEWTEEAIVVAFARGLPQCHALIRNGKVADKEYTMISKDAPDVLWELQGERDERQETLLTVSAMFGHNQLIRLLLDHGFDIGRGNGFGLLSLGCAIVEKQPDACRLLIEGGADINDAGKGSPAIHLAVQYGTLEILEILVNAGQDVNLVNEEESPLHRAAESGTLESVQWLVEHGADLWMRGDSDQSVLDYSLYNSDSTVFEYLLQIYLESDPPEYWKEDALTHAAHACNLNACRTLLDLGANVNGNPQSSETPLFKSMCPNHMHFNQSEVYDLLMALGAELYVGDASKRCALNNAAASNLPDVMKRMIEQDPNIVQWACREGYYGALHAAAVKSRVEACKILIRHGADVNVRDGKGRTPLMHSTPSYSHEALAFLIESGADLHIRDNDGWTVMEYSCKAHDLRKIQILRERSMQLPTEISDKPMNGWTIRGAHLMNWLRQNVTD